MCAVAKCKYDQCQLPDNNRRYILQAVYIVIGILVLCSSEETFTFFQMMLFTAPILIDIACANPGGLPLEIVRWFVGIIDAAIVILSVLGLGGVVTIDAEKVSFISTMVLLGGVSISKRLVSILLFTNLIVPIAYYVGSPCRSVGAMVASANKKGAKT